MLVSLAHSSYNVLCDSLTHWLPQKNYYLQVSTNGVVSFGDPFTNPSSSPFPLSTNDILIAPFWDDSNVESGGQVLFRLSDNQTLLKQVGSIINDRLEYDFTPTMLFIVTWNRIPEFRGSPDIVSVIIITYSCNYLKDTINCGN